MRKKRSEKIEYKEEEADKKRERDNIFFSKPHGVHSHCCSIFLSRSCFSIRFPNANRVLCACGFQRKKEEKEDSEREITAIKGVVGSRL